MPSTPVATLGTDPPGEANWKLSWPAGRGASVIQTELMPIAVACLTSASPAETTRTSSDFPTMCDNDGSRRPITAAKSATAGSGA